MESTFGSSSLLNLTGQVGSGIEVSHFKIFWNFYIFLGSAGRLDCCELSSVT